MMLISVSLNLLFLTLFIRSFSEFKNNKLVLPTYIIVVLIQWYLNQNGMTFYGRWIILLLNLCYICLLYTSSTASYDIGRYASFPVEVTVGGATIFVLDVAPVSYTHLDVYKRQGQYLKPMLEKGGDHGKSNCS